MERKSSRVAISGVSLPLCLLGFSILVVFRYLNNPGFDVALFFPQWWSGPFYALVRVKNLFQQFPKSAFHSDIFESKVDWIKERSGMSLVRIH